MWGGKQAQDSWSELIEAKAKIMAILEKKKTCVGLKKTEH